ncbi:MAG: hypothetical protein IJS47_04410 [Clostridia bacterium]|nr:hypothetical protein [Clostridia bacterium]
MNKELIRTDTFWYKLKKFFNKKITLTSVPKVETKVMLTDMEKKKLGKQLLDDEFMCFDLKEEEANEMLKYFSIQLNQMDAEIERVKSHIDSMKTHV